MSAWPTIRPNPISVYRNLYDIPKDIWLVINIGGRGGAKSYEVAKFAVVKAVQEGKRIAVLRDQKSTIEQSILNEIKLRYEEINAKSNGFYNQHFDFQDRGLKRKKDSVDLIFTKGFQTTSLSQKANLKSISDVDIAIIEEFEDIRDEQKFNIFADSIRKEGSVIIINLNTPDKNHWLMKRFFTMEESGYEGYFKAVPRYTAGVMYNFTTHKDNPFLSEKTRIKYELYGNKESDYYNLCYYCSAILGLVSEGKKGRIFKNWRAITLQEFNNLPYISVAGLDFGYSQDPNALVQIKRHNNNIYINPLLYQNAMSNKEIAIEIKAKLSRNVRVYADSAEPKSIAELAMHGVNIWPATKGTDSLDLGIKTIQSYNVFYVQEPNLENEYQEYSWKLDRDGNITDTPEDKNNHHIDAIRYALISDIGLIQIKKHLGLNNK